MVPQEAQESMLAQASNSSPTHHSASARPFPDPLEDADPLGHLETQDPRDHLVSQELADHREAPDLRDHLEHLETQDHRDSLDAQEFSDLPHHLPRDAQDSQDAQEPQVLLDNPDAQEAVDAQEDQEPVATPDNQDLQAATETPEPQEAQAPQEPQEAATTAHQPVWLQDIKHERSDRKKIQGFFYSSSSTLSYAFLLLVQFHSNVVSPTHIL
jgi:hypothetical protein